MYIIYMTNIHTMVRIKPLLNNINNNIINLNLTKEELVFNEIKKSYDLTEMCKQHIFNFDKVYSDINSTDDIFNDIGIKLVDKFMTKRSSTLFVFGQTGSGKTHTIMGDNKHFGFLKILLSYLSDSGKKIKISALEIYNDICYDILNSNNVIYQREDYSGNILLRGITTYPISNKNDITSVYNRINSNRSVGRSSQNDRSSRSHLQIKIEDNSGNFIKILDLAGSERASQTNNISRSAYRENAEINKSLLVLKECIRSLKNKSSHVPIRGSKLTKLLKDSFTGRCDTYVLGTVSQDKSNIVDSIQTLNYISDLKYIKKIDKLTLPELNTKINKLNRYDSVQKLYDNKSYNYNQSPKYKYLAFNKHKLENIRSNQRVILDKIIKKKTTKFNKLEFINQIDKDIQIMNEFKKQLI